MVLVVLLFPTLASGGEVKWDDLVERNGLHYKKFTNVPFTGKVTGKEQGSFRKGKKDGPFVDYYDNGQLHQKGTFKDGNPIGPWVGYHDNGQLWWKGTSKDGKRVGPWVEYNREGTVDEKYTGTYKNGVKVK
jgi:antitoxin component YwqK of YwqJK toxin-antitoxin module